MAESKELSVTRLIAAPPEAVWDVLANRTNEWWCPVPWRAEVDWGERRAGSATHTVMYSPDGEVHQHPGFTLAWDEGRRIISTDAIVSDYQPNGPFMIGIWGIEPEGDGTRYTAIARHWTEEAMVQHRDMGFIDGWGACADQLKALCEA
jgi:uncharacterized protein YndB with AHSA1/START domain